MSYLTKTLFSQLLIFSLFVSSLPINPVYCSEKKISENDKVAPRKTAIHTEFIKNFTIATFRFALPVMSFYCLYLQIKNTSSVTNQNTKLIFQKITDPKLGDLQITKEQ